MPKLFAPLLAIVLLVLAASFSARGDDGSDHQRSIVSISVCSATATGASVSCPSGTGDTRQPVLAPDGSSPAEQLRRPGYSRRRTLDDIFAGNFAWSRDYLFFVAT